MPTIDEVMVATNEQCGPGTLFKATGLKKDPPRLPSGVFAIDYATGGGFPIWGTSCLWGPESGGKTSIGSNAIKMASLICWECFNLIDYCTCKAKPLKLESVWADVEGTLDRDWVNAIGGDPEKYSVILADYGEQYSNISDNVLKADNCGLLVVDSLAALVPAAEMEAAAEDDFYALQARMIGRMVRKLKQRLIRERKRGHPCCIIFTNQLRMKIGQKFGDPETMSGGHGMKHEFSLLLRCVKKALNETDKTKYVDKKRKKNQAIRHSFAIRKEKILTLSNVGEYIRVVENIPSLDLKKGMIDDMGTVMTYAKEYDIVRKGSGAKPWKYFDYNARTLDDIKLMWKKKDLECLHTKMEIVRRAKERLAGE